MLNEFRSEEKLCVYIYIYIYIYIYGEEAGQRSQRQGAAERTKDDEGISCC
jgi:hypothetical protein